MKDPFVDFQTENSMNTVTTFESKGGNQGGNREDKIETELNSLKNNELQLSVKWIGRVEGGNLLGISKIAMLKHIQQRHFVTRKVKMNGGWGYEISVESMFRYYQSIGDWEKCFKLIHMLKPSASTGSTTGSPTGSANISEISAAKFQTVKLLDEILQHADKKTIAAKRFVAEFNKGIYPELKNIIGDIKLRTLYRWRKILIENDWDPAALEPQYKPIRARSVSNREAEILIPMLLNPNRPLVSEILKEAKSKFIHKGISLKSDATYRRFIEEWINKNIDLWTLGRYGMKAYNDKILKDILRDKDRIEVGDIVVADGHTMNIMVINPLTGKPIRMTLLMFYDFKSDMPLGWEIMPTENILTIASALRRTIMLLGKFFAAEGYVPRIAYLDNGRAFRAKYFRGIKDFKDTILPGLFGKLKIETMYATPYHGQSKTIERWFKTLGELERKLTAYTGTNIAGKPAMLMRNEKLHRRLFDNTPITIETLAYNLEEYIRQYAETTHQDGQYKGFSPAEIFMESVNRIKSSGKHTERVISKNELIYLMLSDETRTIGKNGIRFRGNYYWNEEMPRIIGSKVVIKYDIWDDKEIIIIDEKNRFLFKAQKEEIRHHPAARLLGSEEDIKLLTEALAEKQRMKRETIQEFKDIISIGMPDKDSPAVSEPKKMAKLSESERRKKAMKEYAELIGYKPFANPVEELLKRKAE
jgi:putative transposase